jgi:hypothetical protein
MKIERRGSKISLAEVQLPGRLLQDDQAANHVKFDFRLRSQSELHANLFRDRHLKPRLMSNMRLTLPLPDGRGSAESAHYREAVTNTNQRVTRQRSRTLLDLNLNHV